MKQFLSQLIVFLGFTNLDYGTVKLFIKIVGSIVFGGACAFVLYQCRLKKIRSMFLLGVSIFLIAFGVRFFLIWITPHVDRNNVDICIAVSSGRVVSHGINPYLFSDKVEIRNQLRMESKKCSSWLAETQERWDYQASSNLPLELLFLGLIDKVYSGAIAYRIAFAIMDSLLSVIILLYLFKYLKEVKLYLRIFLILVLSALSPVLLYWGVLYPENKGMQILLMVSALYLAQAESKISRVYVSSFLLGASIAFKLLGIFLLPLCIKYVSSKSGDNDKKWITGDGILYLLLTCIFTFLWFAPFLPESITVLFFGRFKNAVDIGSPIFASIWRTLYMVTPSYWIEIKRIVIFLFMGMIAWGFFKKRWSFEITTGNLLLTFTVLFLEGGSLDRANMAILLSLLLMASTRVNDFIGLTKYYFAGGFILYVMGHMKIVERIAWVWRLDTQYIDGVFVLCYFGLYLAVVIKALRGQKLNVRCTEREFGFRARIPFERGLRRTIDGYIKNLQER